MGLFKWMFGKPLTPAQLVRKNQRAINKAIRNLDRERYNMERQEKKLITDVKKAASASGQMEVCKIIATDIVKTRRYIKKFMLMKANLQAVSIQIITLQSQNAIADAMLGVTIALRGMNQHMQLPQIQRILMEFEKQSTIMDVKGEMMTEATDNALGEDDPEAESDDLVTQVLDELGLQLQNQLPELPGARQAQAQKTPVIYSPKRPASANGADDDLQTRLNNLRRD